MGINPTNYDLLLKKLYISSWLGDLLETQTILQKIRYIPTREGMLLSAALKIMNFNKVEWRTQKPNNP